MHGGSSLIFDAEGVGNFADWVGPFPERGHGREVALLGVRCHLEAGAEEIAGQAVLDDLPCAIEIGER